jgi:hypothetical protein
MTEPNRNETKRQLSRRAFLQAVGGAAALALAASCGARTPPVTPTPTRTPRGTALSQAGRTATPTATATASTTPTAALTGTSTLTPTPAETLTPSATPPPTNTPTPTASPFPPGPASKLGVFVSWNNPKVFELLQTKNVAVVKTLEYDANFVAEMKQMSPDTAIFGRIDLAQLNLADMSDPKGAAQAFVDRLLPIATDPKRMAAIEAWESYNEPTPGSPDEMARLGEFEAQRTRLLAANGIRSVVGNFSTGMPPLEWWPQFRPAIEAAKQTKGYLGLHEYSAPTMQFGTPQDPLGWGTDPNQEGWLTLRYRKVYHSFLKPNNLVLPIVITELGIDGYVTNRPGPPGMGWMDFGGYWNELGMGTDAPGNYVEQLAWYDAAMQQDSYIIGAAIFAGPASPGWETYEVLNDALGFLKQYLSVHPVRP